MMVAMAALLAITSQKVFMDASETEGYR
jgi:hypothetical protein